MPFFIYSAWLHYVTLKICVSLPKTGHLIYSFLLFRFSLHTLSVQSQIGNEIHCVCAYLSQTLGRNSDYIHVLLHELV